MKYVTRQSSWGLCVSALLLLAVVAGWHGALRADEGDTHSERTLHVAVEWFQWQEFDNNGKRLLSENGPRVILGFSFEDGFPRILPRQPLWTKDLRYTVKFMLYTGDVDYDGQTQSLLAPSQSGVFTASTTRYRGWNTELLVDQHFVAATHDTMLFVAIGADGWKRSIADSIDARDNPVGGATEDYRLGYTRLGLGFERHHAMGRIGLKYPLWTQEKIGTATLTPGKQWSLFASYRLALESAARRRYFVGAYLDGYRFGTSPQVGCLPLSVSCNQPESDLTTVGILLGSAF